MRVVFMGTPYFAVPSLGGLITNQYKVVAVYTQPDKEVGRGRKLAVSAVKQAALDRQLPVFQPEGFKSAAAVDELANLQPDVIIVAAYGQLLPQPVLDVPVYGCVNIHPSLLPKFRGASPVAAAILAGEEFTGVSLMLMDRGLDTGPVLAQAQIAISDLDDTGSLTEKLSYITAQLLLDVLPSWVEGEITPKPQNEATASYSGEFSKKDGEIDWGLSAVDIWRRVRAFQPWPGCYTQWQGKQLKIIQAVPMPGEGDAAIGQVVALSGAEAAFGVSTGDGILGILTVQLEGKRVMTGDEFLRGQRQFIGAKL